MTLQTTGNLSNSVRVQYVEKYQEGADDWKLYDQLASPVPMDMGKAQQGSSVQVTYISQMEPREQTISEETDITPQRMRDATTTLSWDSRSDGVKFSERLDFQNFTDYNGKALKRVGENMQLTLELLAQKAALQGTFVERAAARTSLDAGTVAHRLSESVLAKIDAFLQDLMVPTYVNKNGFQQWLAIMSGPAYYDVRTSGNVVEIAKYQTGMDYLKWELGSIGRFKLLSSAKAKVFGSAGADNATAVATTLNGAVKALDKTIVTAADVSASITAGRVWWLGTRETGDTHYAINEPIKILSASGTTLTIAGRGDNGGLLYDHPTGATLRNADTVYPVVFGGPDSLCKLYHTGTGEYGTVLDPELVGNAKQWTQIFWKYYGNFGRWTETGIVRGEFASSLDA